MTSADVALPYPASAPLYARFSRRLRGLFIDWTISLVVMFSALIVASSLRNDDISRVLGVIVILFVLLYEPVLVSMTGGTIGHRMTNMRVVDDATGGNVSFLKAVARFVIKSVIGLYSFVAMAITRRNQAVHDLLTHSTMQIRDASKALPGEFLSEQTELTASNMPPRWRRLLVIAAYIVLTLFAAYAVLVALAALGVIAPRCVFEDICTKQDDRIANVVAGAWMLSAILWFILGWRGKLYGARKTSGV
ncbi:MAG: hypothetical protein A4S14_11285 [Proteobacteria bacterium SG_bin9]|nr:MAG: hypothetical protein A4S14_11285 [Proteobacteria bacterium SG_bin9]